MADLEDAIRADTRLTDQDKNGLLAVIAQLVAYRTTGTPRHPTKEHLMTDDVEIETETETTTTVTNPETEPDDDTTEE